MDFSEITGSGNRFVSGYRAMGVSRYHVQADVPAQDLGAHQARVAVLQMMIWPEARPRVTQYALVHDMEELVTGDLPYPSKSVLPPEAMDAVDNLGRDFTRNFLLLRFNLEPNEHMMVKTCDYLELTLYCNQFKTRGANKIGKKGCELIYKYGSELRESDEQTLINALVDILPDLRKKLRKHMKITIQKLNEDLGQ